MNVQRYCFFYKKHSQIVQFDSQIVKICIFYKKKLHPRRSAAVYRDCLLYSTLRIEFPTTNNIGFGGDGCLGY